MAFDPLRILQTLAEHDVQYILVGATGATLHGSPMLTADVDVVPELKRSNLESLAAALDEMHAKLMSAAEPAGIKVDWSAKDLQRWIVDLRFLNVMTDFGQLDLIHRVGGVGGYHDLVASAEDLELGTVEVKVAALEDIVRSKQAVGRDRDLEQLPTLRALLERKRDA